MHKDDGTIMFYFPKDTFSKNNKNDFIFSCNQKWDVLYLFIAMFDFFISMEINKSKIKLLGTLKESRFIPCRNLHMPCSLDQKVYQRNKGFVATGVQYHTRFCQSTCCNKNQSENKLIYIKQCLKLYNMSNLLE